MCIGLVKEMKNDVYWFSLIRKKVFYQIRS